MIDPKYSRSEPRTEPQVVPAYPQPETELLAEQFFRDNFPQVLVHLPEALMIAGARYGHTNLIARDWRALSRFYQDLFGCVPVPPVRDFHGAELERGTGVAGAALRGEHLLLPGYGPDGPTLEIFNYSIPAPETDRSVNRPGFGHIAFVVDDVTAAREAVLAAGGKAIGEVVVTTNALGQKLAWAYVSDPEGNALELQAPVE